MTARTWIRNLFARPVTRPVRKAAARCRPAVEALEDRLTPATLVVTNNLDTSDGSPRAALDAANASIDEYNKAAAQFKADQEGAK